MNNFQKLEFLGKDENKNAIMEKKMAIDIMKLIFRNYKDTPDEKEKAKTFLQDEIKKDVLEYINSLDRKELIHTAYTLERYSRRAKGEKDLIGGLHDYVFKISDDQIRNYIFKKLEEHKEMNDVEKLDKLVKQCNRLTEESGNRDFIMQSGVHEYISKLEKEKLKKLALGLEDYHRKQRDEFIFGGLHDYINNISEEELKSYIAKEVNEHVEINRVSALDEIINKNH